MVTTAKPFGSGSMGELTTIMARDGHEFQSWLVAPQAKPRGAVVVVQEIYGVNAHIRAVTDGFAAQGYTAIAPSLFDRVRRGIQLGYTPADTEQGVGYRRQIEPDTALKDIAASAAVVKHSGRTGVVGYCWGGALAYLAACQLPLACAVVYYGRVADYLDRRPRCPVMYHFGGADQSIPESDRERIQAAAAPGTPFYVYEGAGHGFNCDQRSSYDSQAAALAAERTREFLARHLRGSGSSGEPPTAAQGGSDAIT
ncbi:MAG TPA: dienelactone hydrolase family protein [Steroidobacteraceae bacterium]|jgi:carboxymethylenebutenolidase|nr:dienelactone hydrolase family protein [Steroidobacteraceae bacterium]